jgi:uncharacterized membrane protein YgcG
MKTVKRMLRHLFTTTAAGRRAFPASTLKAIQAAIARGEAVHRAELRLVIEPSLTMQEVLGGMTSRQRARELFSDYRIWDTEENCGVLIYVNLADHKVEIIADRTVNKLVTASEWQDICRVMTKEFANGRFEESVTAALEKLNGMLQERFPANGDRPNQLSNRPLIL